MYGFSRNPHYREMMTRVVFGHHKFVDLGYDTILESGEI